MSVVSAILGGGFADLVNATGLGFSNLAGSALGEGLRTLFERRAATLRETLLDEVQSGVRSPRDAAERDEFVAILYRCWRAALEGGARINLRLMAKAVRGQIERDAVSASDFLRYADLIATLTRNEIALLATFHRCEIDFRNKNTRSDWSDWQNINADVKRALVPNVFPSNDHYIASITALQRTGMVWPAAASTGGGFVYASTPRLSQVIAVASFEEVLAAEPENQ